MSFCLIQVKSLCLSIQLRMTENNGINYIDLDSIDMSCIQLGIKGNNCINYIAEIIFN